VVVGELLPLFVSMEWKGRRGSAGRRGGIHGGAAGLKQRKGGALGEEERGADRWAGVSAAQRKKKRRRGAGPLREGERWAGGLLRAER
jgi:hypothetical protein